jgi:hypothetical protein
MKLHDASLVTTTQAMKTKDIQFNLETNKIPFSFAVAFAA